MRFCASGPMGPLVAVPATSRTRRHGQTMAGSRHLRKHRGGAADCHRVALVLRQRTPQHGQPRNDPCPETENGRVNSTTRTPQKCGDYFTIRPIRPLHWGSIAPAFSLHNPLTPKPRKKSEHESLLSGNQQLSRLYLLRSNISASDPMRICRSRLVHTNSTPQPYVPMLWVVRFNAKLGGEAEWTGRHGAS